MSVLPFVSDTFDAARWKEIDPNQLGVTLTDVTYHRGISRSETLDGKPAGALMPVVRIAFDRPELRNAFRPHTVDELLICLEHAKFAADVAAIIITGNGPSPKDGGYGFCSGGDQRIRGRDGYCYEVQNSQEEPVQGSTQLHAAPDPAPGRENGQGLHAQPTSEDTHDRDVAARRAKMDKARGGRLHILEVQRAIRHMPKPVIAVVNGWAAGGGHSLNVVCDLSIASREHARFKQTDANVGSFDAGYGSALLARQVGDKRAREIFYLAETYTAQQAEQWGVVNRAVAHEEIEDLAWQWAKTIATKSPQAIRMLKYAFNLADDGLAGQQLFAGEATRLAYMTDEAQEGRDAFNERREPDWSPFPYYF